MAVFTDVSLDDARALIEPLQIGTLTSLRGIGAGIENSNYFLDTDRGQWVLTVFERLTFDELPYYLELMRHLAQHRLPVPQPQARSDDRSLVLALRGKPCAVVDKLDGNHVRAPQANHCRQLGHMLARMHLAGRDFARTQPNLRGLAWWVDVAPQLTPYLKPAQADLMAAELGHQQARAAAPDAQSLPRGAIHGDLFRDNAMFVGDAGHERLSGIFDFYFAGTDTFVYDLAVSLNDWCIDLDTGAHDQARAHALLAGYAAVRALDADERRLLPDALRAAALRFWISRLWDLHLPRDARLLVPHDPAHFERVLRARIDQPWHA